MRKVGVLIIAAASLSACATPVTPRYAIGTDNAVTLRNLNLNGIGVGEFAEPANDDVKCRGIGRMRMQDGLTHAQYVRKAFTDELKIAGAYADAPSRITITGALIEIDSSSGLGSMNGHWLMTLALKSSNGSSLTVSNNYPFRAGYAAVAACNNVAQAFVPAVQDIIGKALRSPEFPSLVN